MKKKQTNIPDHLRAVHRWTGRWQEKLKEIAAQQAFREERRWQLRSFDIGHVAYDLVNAKDTKGKDRFGWYISARARLRQFKETYGEGLSETEREFLKREFHEHCQTRKRIKYLEKHL